MHKVLAAFNLASTNKCSDKASDSDSFNVASCWLLKMVGVAFMATLYVPQQNCKVLIQTWVFNQILGIR